MERAAIALAIAAHQVAVREARVAGLAATMAAVERVRAPAAAVAHRAWAVSAAAAVAAAASVVAVGAVAALVAVAAGVAVVEAEAVAVVDVAAVVAEGGK